MHIEADRILAAGTDRTVYLDGESVIKLFEADCPAAPVFAEAMNAIHAGEAGIPVPEVEGVVRMEERWAIRSRYAEGKTLAYLMHREPENMEKHLNCLVGMMLRVNGTPSDFSCTWKERLASVIRETVTEEAKIASLSERLAALPDGTGMVHGDLMPSNLLISDEGEAFLVDWRHAAGGCSETDAAFTYLRLLSDGMKETADQFLSVYMTAAGIKREKITAWFPVAAVYLTHLFRNRSYSDKRARLAEYIR